MSCIGTNKVGKMFLGDVAIGKDYLGSELVYEAGGATPASYIDTGLVFHLDGADATLNEWVSRVGNIPFEMHNVTLNGAGGVVFNGTNSYGYYANTLGYQPESCTIEVVANHAASSIGLVFMQNADGLLVFGFSTAAGASKYVATSTNPTKRMWSVPNTGLGVYSAANNSLYRNKVLCTSDPDGYTARAIGGTFLGGRTSSENFLNGTIYQIRIYNRILNENEILFNQTIDINKYNIS